MGGLCDFSVSQSPSPYVLKSFQLGLLDFGVRLFDFGLGLFDFELGLFDFGLGLLLDNWSGVNLELLLDKNLSLLKISSYDSIVLLVNLHRLFIRN